MSPGGDAGRAPGDEYAGSADAATSDSGPSDGGSMDAGPFDQGAPTEVVVRRGVWENAGYAVRGTSEIVRLPDGSFEIRMSDDFVAANLPGPTLRLDFPASEAESGAILRRLCADARAASGGGAQAGRGRGRARRRGGRRWHRGPVPGRLGAALGEGVRCGRGAVPRLRRPPASGGCGDASRGGAGGARRGALGPGPAGSTQRVVTPGLIRGRALEAR